MLLYAPHAVAHEHRLLQIQLKTDTPHVSSNSLPTIKLHSHVAPLQLSHCVRDGGCEYFGIPHIRICSTASSSVMNDQGGVRRSQQKKFKPVEQFFEKPKKSK
ncbi:hypothetical protein RB195_012070 [Necator americanus]|uniref:Uncharacterized protein n=1 Tax=Necator americanus TaxID=51031 RepID=A0ABR1D5E7_NECAM